MMKNQMREATNGSLYEDPLELSLVIPVYNRWESIPEVSRNILQALKGIESDYEVIFVNDGSTDDTLEALYSESRMNSHIKVLTYEQNSGKGYAIKCGVASSIGRNVIFIDGDLDISPGLIQDYLGRLKYHHLVIGSKSHPRSKVQAPISRKILSKIFNFYVRSVAGIHFRDTQAGLKGGRGPFMRSIFRLMKVRRYAFDVEFLSIANSLNLSVEEMPVELNISKNLRFIDIGTMLIDVLLIAHGYRFANHSKKASIRARFEESISPDTILHEQEPLAQQLAD